MAMKRLLRQLDNAFVEKEEQLPKMVDSILGSIESWLKQEEAQTEPFVNQRKAEFDASKFALAMNLLGKECDFAASVKLHADQVIMNTAFIHGKRQAFQQSLPSFPKYAKERWFRLGQDAAYRLFPFLIPLKAEELLVRFVSPSKAILVYSSLPDAKKSALLSKIANRFDRF